MNALQSKVQLIADDLSANQGVDPGIAKATDFLTWLMEMFEKFIPLLLGCFASTEAQVAALQNPNWFQTIRFNAFLRREMNDRNMERRLLSQVSASARKVGATITKDEWAAMVAEAA